MTRRSTGAARGAGLALALLAATILAGACRDEDRGNTEPPPSSGGSAIGPGLSVAEARASRLDQPLLVSGFVIAEGSRARLCDALLESFPPRCGGASLEVRGLDVGALGGIEVSGSVRWSAKPRQLLGEVKNGVMTVSVTSKG